MTFDMGATNCQGLISDATDVVVNNTIAQYSSPIQAIAPLMLVAWESSDLQSFSPPSAPLLQVAATTTSNSFTGPGSDATQSASLAQGTSQSANTSSAQGLAEDAKIGIGVGTACGAILTCIMVGVLTYRFRVRHLRDIASEAQQTGASTSAGILPKAELGGESHVHEIGGQEIFAEADNMGVRYELEGDWHGHEARNM